jgi:hypothetical protein
MILSHIKTIIQNTIKAQNTINQNNKLFSKLKKLYLCTLINRGRVPQNLITRLCQ